MIDLRHGDMRDVLPTLEAESVHSCVTDPPYHLTSGNLAVDWAALGPSGSKRISAGHTNGNGRGHKTGFMGKQWDGGSIAFDPDTWRAVHRVLRPGGYLLAMGGTRTFHRLACAIEDAGFEVRDTIAWVYGSGFPKSLDIGKAIDRAAGAEREVVGLSATMSGISDKHGSTDGRTTWDRVAAYVPITAPATAAARQWNGWGTALKPSMELVVVARRPLSERTVAANVLKHSTGGINIDKCRVTAQRPSDTLSAWEQDQYLCASCAEHAEQIKRPGSPETRASSATRRAEPTLSESQRKPSRDTLQNTATGWSDGMLGADISTSSSTDTSGKKLTDQSQMDLSSTTSTRTNSTTGLRTCNSCGAAITYATTTECISPATKTSPLDVSQPKSAETGSVLIPHGARKSGLGASPRTDAPGQPSARWPSNLAHDGSPEVEAAFAAFGQAGGGYGTAGGKQEHAAFGGGMKNRGNEIGFGDTGTASRFFYSAKATSADRADSRHPTIKPVDLIRWLVKMVTPPNGTVLDPFAGSGTTGEAAMLEGFNAILIEREAEHAADIAHRQRRWHGGDLPLFAEAAD